MGYKVTDDGLDKFNDEIIKAADMLQVATLCLRSLYVIKSPSVDSFVKLRKKITNYAKIYSERVLPISNDLIRIIQSFCNLYESFNFDQFKQHLDYFIKEANEDVKKCELTQKLYLQVLEEFKDREKEVLIVLDQLKLKTKEYEQKKEELLKSGKVKLNWAVCLTLVPVVNVIAGPILYVKGKEDIKNAIAESEEELLTVLAAEAIRGPLIESLTNLVDTFKYISGFFKALIDDLNELNKLKGLKIISDEDYFNKVAEVHYNRMNKKASIIKMACRTYLSKIPDIETNLEAIPDDYDKNYVRRWLSRTF